MLVGDVGHLNLPQPAGKVVARAERVAGRVGIEAGAVVAPARAAGPSFADGTAPFPRVALLGGYGRHVDMPFQQGPQTSLPLTDSNRGASL